MKPRLERIPCPLCKSRRFDHIAIRFDGLNIVRCKECKLAYLNPRPVAEEIFKLYGESYYCGRTSEEIGPADYCRSTGIIKYYSPWGWEILLEETCLVNMRVLDIGCASGRLVYWMSKAGAKAVGIDISKEIVEWGREKLGLDLRDTILETLDVPEEWFDVITMIDLIEHIVDLNSFMTRLTYLLKPGGLVFVQTPNFESYQTWRDKGRYLIFGLEHLLYFDVNSMDNLFARYNMFPSRETSVLYTIPCDIETYVKSRGSVKSKLRYCLGRLPSSFDFVHLVLAKLLRDNRIYRYDDSRREGSLVLGCYTKKRTERFEKL